MRELFEIQTFLSSYKEQLRDLTYKKFILHILSLGFFVRASQFSVVTNSTDIMLEVNLCRGLGRKNFTYPPIRT